MVGVNMSIDDIADLHTTFFRHPEIGLRIVDGVAHGGQTSSTSTEDVRGGDGRIRLKQLPENH